MNYLLRNIVKLFTICFFHILFVSFAVACMCREKSVGSEFEEASSIIIANLEPYEFAKINSEEKQNTLEVISLVKSLPKLKVQKVFKGSMRVGEVLEFDGVYRCNVIFAEVGGDYLLYLGDKPEKGELWQLPGCSKSGLSENRLADLLYFSKEKKVRNKTRIAGRLFYDIDSISQKDKSQLITLANRKVYFVGEKHQFETRTDENGVYEIYDLPAGTFKIFSENIFGWKSEVSNYDSEIVEIEKSGQYERDFKYKIAGSISKNFFDVKELSAKTCSESRTAGIVKK